MGCLTRVELTHGLINSPSIFIGNIDDCYDDDYSVASLIVDDSVVIAIVNFNAFFLSSLLMFIGNGEDPTSTFDSFDLELPILCYYCMLC